jgi:hypothetical protein
MSAADAYHLVLGAQRQVAPLESPVGVVDMTHGAHAQQMKGCAAVVLEASNEDHVAFLGDHSPLHWEDAAERLAFFVDPLLPDEQDSVKGIAVASHPGGMSN